MATRIAASILVWTLYISLSACNFGNTKNEPVWSDLPEVIRLEKLKQTDFAITLENPISEHKNIIYASAFLFAWDKIKEELKSPIIVDSSNSAEFILLNKSSSHLSALNENEYSATAEVVDGAIVAKAFFNKTLPFATKLHALDEPIVFSGVKVSSFGMMDYDESVASLIQVLYYKDDDHFILKLMPKDQHHEIILAKGLSNYRTLKDGIEQANDYILKGENERIDRRHLWKYQIKPTDILAIPVIQFNIENSYQNIEGQKLSTINDPGLWVETAYQRTGFVLNETGAVIESNAVTAVVDSASAEIIVASPKKLIFDKQFLIIVKRTEQTNPYFAMKVVTAELLVKKIAESAC